MAKELAIVLNNGSINSAVTTALAAQRFRLVMLHMILAEGEDEGAETATRSRVAFDQQTGHYKPYREHVLELSFLTQLQAPGGPKKSVEGAEAKQQSRMGAAIAGVAAAGLRRRRGLRRITTRWRSILG